VSDDQAAYAVASARLELRLGELRDALARREAERADWTQWELLERFERVVAALVEEVRRP